MATLKSRYISAAILALGLAGESSVSAMAQGAYEEYSKPVTGFNFGPAFHAPKGKKLAIISCGAIAEGCAGASSAAKEAADVLGWQARIIDGKMDPLVWNQSVQQAVADGYDGIIAVAITPALIQGGLDAAGAADIPIVTLFIPVFKDVPETAVHISSDHVKDGEAGAEFLTKDSDGKGSILILDTPQFPELMQRNNSLADNLKTMCSGCTVIRQNFDAASASQRLAGQVASLLTSNPAVNYVELPYDAAAPFVSQGIRQSGKSDSVRLFTYEGSTTGIKMMQNGEIYADIGTPLGFAAWLGVDAMARKLEGVDSPKALEFPMHVFAPGDKLPEKYWEPEFDYRSALKALWQ